MHIISQERYNPKKGCVDRYYRIKESYRDVLGKVHSYVLLNVGFLEGFLPGEIGDIARGLTYLSKHQGEGELFASPLQRYRPIVREHIERFWRQILDSGRIDVAHKSLDAAKAKAKGMVDLDTIEHTEARDVGAENLCLQALRQLKFDDFLSKKGWSEKKIDTALAHLIVRTVYSPSENKSLRIMEDNSAVCELVTGKSDGKLPSKRSIYEVAPALYELKDELEKHLCGVTDNLFNLTSRVMIFDLTNFFFEGRKEKSKKARFGRSKEKRSDCKLVVLALCINAEGFIRYSSILEGNTSDPASLPNMIDNLIAKNPVSSNPNDKVLVVLDAGISTEENLKLIKDKEYNYLCVSRTRLRDYEYDPNKKTVIVHDTKKQEIKLREVLRAETGDYYLEINSETKAMKESSMNRKFRERFETELVKAQAALSKKGGKKQYERVVERVGRAIEKYPSIAKHYEISYIRDEVKLKNMADIQWVIKEPDKVDKSSGVYFLRTNIKTLDEKTTWDYYNLIREIECTNRQLKTDLNLRPIYHQKDENTDAHLFFGLLAYWVVNTIRYQLKQANINHYWTEIVRIMSTQKAVTTEAINALGEKVKFRICSNPTGKAKAIYTALRYNKTPFRKMKLCSTQ